MEKAGVFYPVDERVKIDAGRSMRYLKYVHREAC